MGVAIILAGSVVEVAAGGLVGGQSLQPILIIPVQSTLIVVRQKNTITSCPSC